ncbi:MAG: ribosome-binding factor A [Salibacteraceae bacterium]
MPLQNRIKMSSLRQDKVSELLRRELSTIIQRSEAGMLPGKMTTVTTVRISPDLSFAKVYVSVFPTSDLSADVAVLKEHVPQIRFTLGKSIRHQLRIVPQIAFYGDDSLDYADEIDQLLKE